MYFSLLEASEPKHREKSWQQSRCVAKGAVGDSKTKRNSMKRSPGSDNMRTGVSNLEVRRKGNPRNLRRANERHGIYAKKMRDS